MTAIELAASKGYWNVWLESDSQLVLQAFKSNMIIPWSLRNRWYNYLVITHNMRFFASHIYREGNVCADGLANFGLTLSNFDLFWFNNIPDFIKGEYIKNRLGISNYRFTTFRKDFSLVPLFCFVLFLFSMNGCFCIFYQKKKRHIKY